MKKTFALRVDSEMYDAIERWAADEFRSTNGQIEWILSEALKKAKRYPKRTSDRGGATQNESNRRGVPPCTPTDGESESSGKGVSPSAKEKGGGNE